MPCLKKWPISLGLLPKVERNETPVRPPPAPDGALQAGHAVTTEGLFHAEMLIDYYKAIEASSVKMLCRPAQRLGWRGALRDGLCRAD